jgi:hypothetical protein
MTRPLIQIDDIGTAREMTEEEHAAYLEMQASAPPPLGSDETPSET